MDRPWKRVVFTFEFGEDQENPCPSCGEYVDGCECPGPNSETDDGEPYEFKEVDGVMYAREPKKA